jgi:hypothetical protein
MRRFATAAGTALVALLVAVAASGAPPQGTQNNDTFRDSYGTHGVRNVWATTDQVVSCYAPEVPYATALGEHDGYPGGGQTPARAPRPASRRSISTRKT